DLRGVRSIAELQERLRAHAGSAGIWAGDGTWLLGRGFEQDRLAEGRWPTQQDLDAVSPEVPVRITRVCGPALGANRAAVRAGRGGKGNLGSGGCAPRRIRCWSRSPRQE